MEHKKNSIYWKLARLLLLAAVLSAAFFILAQAASDYLLEHYFEDALSQYDTAKIDQAVADLCDYIEENQIASTDRTLLTAWVKKTDILSMQIYKNNVLVYDSNYPEKETILENEEEIVYYSWPSYYTLPFVDGDADALFYGYYSYRIYDYILFAELFLSFLLFVLTVMLGIRKSMRYIRRLSNEIHILEGGDLDYEITVRGNDELAALAQGLDDMRRAFRKQMESESYLMRSNQKLLAQMSHDLRTPLTTILLYTGILKEHAYETEEELMLYLEKLEMKAQQLKHLSENMVSYALVSSESRSSLEPPESFRVLFSDPLSELAGYLEQNDFFVIPPESLPTQMVCVNSDYIMRIMDNISSNILKYAAPGYPVQIKAMETDHQICLSFQNRKNASSQDTEGYRIGLESIRNMMAQMHGSSEVVQDGTSFELRLFFPRLSSQ